MIALITSSNGRVPSELRGLYAWLPVLLPPDRVLDLHQRDPYSVLAYGDARSLPATIRRDALIALGNMDDPWFRSRVATEPGLSSLVTTDLEDELSALLSDKGALVHARTFVCDALAANRGPMSLLSQLEAIVVDATEVPYLRATALSALLSISDSVGNFALPRSIFARLQTELPKAAAARLRIVIVAHLWPDHATATDVLQVIEDWKKRTRDDDVLGYLRPLERQLEEYPRKTLFDRARVEVIRGIHSAGHGTEEDHLFLQAAQSFLRTADPLDGKTLHRVLSCVRKNDTYSGQDLPGIVRERLSRRPALGAEWLDAMLLDFAPEDWDWEIAYRTLGEFLGLAAAKPIFSLVVQRLSLESDAIKAGFLFDMVRTAIARSGWTDHDLFSDLKKAVDANTKVALPFETRFLSTIDPRDQERRRTARALEIQKESARRSIAAKLIVT